MQMFKDPRITTMAGVMLAMLLSALDQTIVATAMPQIVADLQGLAHLSWVFTSYMLASTVAVPLYGKLSDIYGRRFFYLFGIAIFLIGSMLSGAAHSMLALILFRGLQGIGGGAIMVNSFAIIGDLFPPAERGRWQGLIGAVFGISSVLGPFLGGWLTDTASWRWIFYINIPLGLLAFAVIYATLPRIAHKKEKAIDYIGGILLGAALVPFLLALVWGGSEYAWGSTTIVSLLAASAVLLGLFIITERRAADPVLPLWFFKNRSFVVSVSSVFLTAIGMFGSILYLPLFAQKVVGFSATHAGLVLTPLMLGIVAASTLTGQVISRTGKYKVLTVCGIAIMAFGMYLLSRMGADSTPAEIISKMAITGLGLGVTMPVFTLTVQNAFDPRHLGAATASVQMFRSVGGTVGTALLGGLLNYEMVGRGLGFAPALSGVFITSTVVVAAAFCVALFLPEVPLRAAPRRPALEEAGIELEEELGVSSAAHEAR